jgi:hypothetical protein
VAAVSSAPATPSSFFSSCCARQSGVHIANPPNSKVRITYTTATTTAGPPAAAAASPAATTSGLTATSTVSAALSGGSLGLLVGLRLASKLD